jgi:hypothetical protein
MGRPELADYMRALADSDATIEEKLAVKRQASRASGRANERIGRKAGLALNLGTSSEGLDRHKQIAGARCPDVTPRAARAMSILCS